MKICIVSSCGGHLTEVRALKPAYERYDHFYVLNERVLLPQDMVGKTCFIRHSERDWLFVMNIWEAWRILRKLKPSLILSTGAGPIVPFAVVAKILRIPTLFVETFTRVVLPSLTGRMMYYMADRFFYQWRSLEAFFPKGVYGGRLLRDEDSRSQEHQRSGDFVLVTIGNATQGFRRLLEGVDALAGQGFFQGKAVVIQTGNNPGFRALHCRQEAFLPMDQFAEMIHEADLVICHAGAGTLFHVLQAGRVPVVMPRRKKYGEHVDDHQVELVRALAAEGRVIPVYEPEDLPKAIDEARRRHTQRIPAPSNEMLTLVTLAIKEFLKEPTEPTGEAPLAVVILSYNEERNLPDCLESVAGWTREIFVVDTGSTDRTREIAREYGAIVVEHPFETHAKQWNWAIRTLPISSEWVLALDADQRVTPELRKELTALLHRGADGTDQGKVGEVRQSCLDGVDGFYIKRRQIFRGRWIRHGSYYPKYLLKLFRRGRSWSDEGELTDHRFYVSGRTARLDCDLIEDNQNEIDILVWMQKHVVYAGRQAKEEFLRRENSVGWSVRPSLFGTPDQRTLWLKRVWYRMPIYVRPFLYFGYRYILRLGFLDGRQGLLFHFLQAFWYRIMVDVLLDELRRQPPLARKDSVCLKSAQLSPSENGAATGNTHRSR